VFRHLPDSTEQMSATPYDPPDQKTADVGAYDGMACYRCLNYLGTNIDPTNINYWAGWWPFAKRWSLISWKRGRRTDAAEDKQTQRDYYLIADADDLITKEYATLPDGNRDKSFHTFAGRRQGSICIGTKAVLVGGSVNPAVNEQK